MRRTFALTITLISLVAPPAWAGPAAAPEAAHKETPPAAVDGLFTDWEDADAAWSDATGDGDPIDLGRLWVRSDLERVTLRFELGREMNLQGAKSLTLIIDGDANSSTGRTVHGVGAELTWTFGSRNGRIVANGAERTVEHSDLGMRQAPTVSSREFEVSFLRTTPDGHSIIPGPEASMIIVNEGQGGDRLPDDGAVTVRLSPDPPRPAGDVALERRSPDDIRVVTWNVLFDGLFKRPAPFFRVLRALNPDIICFQEIWAHTALHTAEQVSLALPAATWHGESTNEGLIVSRYPLLDARPIDSAGNYWALVDLPGDRYDVDISVISAHPPCCEKEAERQAELDGIAAWVRDLSRGGDPSTPDGTPIVIAGDMNLVGGARQLRTLVAGEIVDENTYGASLPLDWDRTPLEDSRPRHAGGLDTFTWRDSQSSFAPGRLDFIVYSDSVLELSNSFVLATEELNAKDLARYGLRATDTLEASDHLPVVADFTLRASPARTEAAE